eukprot:2967097-Prymnesium_polylepis.1
MMDCTNRGGERAAWRGCRRRAAGDRTVPLRCPACIIEGPLPRLSALRSAKAVRWLHEGRPFVTNASAAFGADGSMLRWDFDYLQRHLSTTCSVHLVNEKLLMSHSTRYSGEKFAVSSSSFPQSSIMTSSFRQYVDAAQRRVRDGSGPRPYAGADLFKRAHKGDAAGRDCVLSACLLADLSVLQRGTLEAMHSRSELPLLSSIHLFVGIAETLYHCHCTPAAVEPKNVCSLQPLSLLDWMPTFCGRRPQPQPSLSARRPQAFHPIPTVGLEIALPLLGASRPGPAVSRRFGCSRRWPASTLEGGARHGGRA